VPRETELSSIDWFGKLEIQGETTLRIYLARERFDMEIQSKFVSNANFSCGSLSSFHDGRFYKHALRTYFILKGLGAGGT
jgi:hypothetical protein